MVVVPIGLLLSMFIPLEQTFYVKHVHRNDVLHKTSLL